MNVREFRDGDESALKDIFYSAIRENASAYYSEQQLQAWAPEEMDDAKWKERMQGIKPYVAYDEHGIFGYADLQENGYIDHFFVKGGSAKKGIGRVLMEYIIDKAKQKGIKELSSDVSLAAQGFYTRFGFTVEKRKQVSIRGVLLENALMKKQL